MSNARRDGRLVDGVYDVVEQLDPIARSKDRTMVQLALAWVMRQPGSAVSPFYEADFGPHPHRV